MDRNSPVRKPHASTADLLTWREAPLPDTSSLDPSTPGTRPTIRMHQPAGGSVPYASAENATFSRRKTVTFPPAGGISSVLFGGQMTPEEAESLLKRKPCSGSKWREMTGSGIFAANGENDAVDSGNAISTPKQSATSISQISFSIEESVSPKKPTSIAEVAKQRELSGTLETDTDAKTNKQFSDAKSKELSGHDIFGPPPEISSRPLVTRSIEFKESRDIGEPAPRNVRTSVKVSNPAGGQSNIMFGDETPTKSAKKIHNQKFQELTGNDIFKGDAPSESAEKSLSVAKLREMSGNDIFADGKAASRDYLGGVRKPPGGESSIALV